MLYTKQKLWGLTLGHSGQLLYEGKFFPEYFSHFLSPPPPPQSQLIHWVAFIVFYKERLSYCMIAVEKKNMQIKISAPTEIDFFSSYFALGA